MFGAILIFGMAHRERFPSIRMMKRTFRPYLHRALAQIYANLCILFMPVIFFLLLNYSLIADFPIPFNGRSFMDSDH